MAAALAFYTTLSLAPMMVLTMAVIGTFASREATRDALLAGVGDALGTEGVVMVENVVRNWSMPSATWWMPVVGVVVLLWASTSAFNQLRLALNRILDVSARSRKRMAHALWSRLLALCLVGIIVLLLAASMALSSMVTLLDETLTPNFPGFHGWLERVGPAGSWLMSCLLFYVIYRMLPDRKLPWRPLLTSALVAASLFAASKFGLDYFLGRGHGVASMYGTAGSMVVIQIWIFVANLILLGGAEWMHAMLDVKSGDEGDAAESEAGETHSG
jgi:membrane protein